LLSHGLALWHEHVTACPATALAAGHSHEMLLGYATTVIVGFMRMSLPAPLRVRGDGLPD